MSWIRAYRVALRLMPPAFRKQFGPPMEADFEQGLAEAGPTFGFLGAAFWDVLKQGIAQRISDVRLGSVAILMGCLATGLLVGKADSQANEPQGTVVVLMLAGGLLGAIWRRRALPFAVALALGVPLMEGIIAIQGNRGAGGPGLLVMVPALIGLAFGVVVGKVLDSCEEGVGALGIGLVFGFLFGFCRVILAQPIVLGGCCLLAGVGFGRAVPKKALFASLILVVGAMTAEAIGSGMASQLGFEALFVDLGLSLLVLPGSALGMRFGQDDSVERLPLSG